MEEAVSWTGSGMACKMKGMNDESCLSNARSFSACAGVVGHAGEDKERATFVAAGKNGADSYVSEIRGCCQAPDR